MSEPSREPSTVRHRVLIVEDDVSTAAAIARRATRAGWGPHLASSVGMARAVLEQNFDAITVDLGLPDGSGFELIEILRARGRSVAVLIVTGSSDPIDINRANRLHTTYERKPLPTNAIEDFLREAISLRLTTLEDEVCRLSVRCNLPSALVRLIKAAARESSAHELLALRLGLKDSTIRTQVRQILQRTGDSSLEEVVAPLRARAFTRDG